MPHAIEAAHTPDVAAIAALWEAGWHDAHAGIVPEALCRLRTPDSFLARIRDALTATRVVRLDGAVAGFCMVRGNELYQMYVAPAARGTGVAQALIADAEVRIAAMDHVTAWLACAVGNTRAARFYEKCGWVNKGTETVMLDGPDGGFPLEVWRFERSLVRRYPA